MPRASGARSQQPKPSQAHPRASQSQRTRRSSRRDEEEEEEDDAQEDADADVDADGDVDMDAADGTGDVDADIARKAADLVRLALFMEQKRTPLRREDISKKVLGSSTRAFRVVLAQAQHILHKTFAMELVELRSRAELDKPAAGAGVDGVDEARKATGVKKRAAAAGSKTYILRSTLDPLIIEHAALTDEAILEEEAMDAPDDDEEEGGPGTRVYGSVIAWSQADELAAAGVLYVVLTLILVSGRVLSDADLRANMGRLRLGTAATVPFSARATHREVPLETHLGHLMRQGYLDRQLPGDARRTGAGGKRGRAAAALDESGAVSYEWRWGARAHSEVGEAAIARFIAEFMAGDVAGEDDEEEGAARGRDAEAQARLARALKGVERAAGGALADIM